MNNNLIFGAIGFIFFSVLSRTVSANASKKLDTDTRHRIYDEFAARNSLKTIIIASIAVMYLLSVLYLASYAFYLSVALFILLFGYLFINLYLVTQRLKSIQAPEKYINSIIISWILYIAGFGSLAVAAFYK